MLLLAFVALASPAAAQDVPHPGEEIVEQEELPLEEEDEVLPEGWDEDDLIAEVGQEEWVDPGIEQDNPFPAPRPELPQLPPLVKGKIVPGRVARLRHGGKAAIPRGAPQRVRKLIRALNEIVGKPYKWGGGHGRLVDSGYDCSGSVGYGLIRVGLQRGPMVSGQMARSWSAGSGRWVSVYAHRGHVYMEVAGLRLDTSPVGDPSGRRGVRWRPPIGKRGGFAARHPAGL
jgi:hypothetical protein